MNKPSTAANAHPVTPDSAASGNRQPSLGRRRFLSKGAAFSPAVVTLASQPALAATCFTPSRSLSKNMSVSQAGKYGVCNGISPGNYKTQTDPGSPSYNWPAAPSPSTPFHSLFAGNLFVVPLRTGGSRSLTLFEVLSLPRNVPADVASVPRDPAKIGFHMVGAYLNIQKGLVPSVVLTPTALLTMWSEFSRRNYYELWAGGPRWSASDIVSYLKNSQVAP